MSFLSDFKSALKNAIFDQLDVQMVQDACLEAVGTMNFRDQICAAVQDAVEDQLSDYIEDMINDTVSDVVGEYISDILC